MSLIILLVSFFLVVVGVLMSVTTLAFKLIILGIVGVALATLIEAL